MVKCKQLNKKIGFNDLDWKLKFIIVLGYFWSIMFTLWLLFSILVFFM